MINQCDKKLLDVLRLIRSRNVGVARFWTLMQIYGNAKKGFEGWCNLLKRKNKYSIADIASVALVQKEIEQVRKYGADFLLYDDCAYPKQLRNIVYPPPVLTTYGDVSVLSKKLLAVVGSRTVTIIGRRMTQSLVNKLCECNINIVSGMALGVDSLAHQTAVDCGAETIAVLGSGINCIYPSDCKKLYHDIKNCGVVISEFSFGFQPQKYTFVQRNRTISGLSLGVLITEATIKSGSLCTANYALEQGREVFAVPGHPLDEKYCGTNALIKNGAVMVLSGDDIIDVINNARFNNKQTELFECEDDEFICDSILKEKDIEYAKKIILDLLTVFPVDTNDIVSESGLSIRLILIALMELELEEKVTRIGWSKFSKAMELV